MLLFSQQIKLKLIGSVKTLSNNEDKLRGKHLAVSRTIIHFKIEPCKTQENLAQSGSKLLNNKDSMQSSLWPGKVLEEN